MAIPDEVRLLIEGAGILGSAAMILVRLGRLGERFDHHSADLKDARDDLKDTKEDINKIKDALAIVAVQKDQIQSIREAQTANTKRTDETFTRVFAILDRMQQR
jgi:hypothetical protein